LKSHQIFPNSAGSTLLPSVKKSLSQKTVIKIVK
jgi:hypothetical protein